jgi:hypothetical protein
MSPVVRVIVLVCLVLRICAQCASIVFSLQPQYLDSYRSLTLPRWHGSLIMLVDAICDVFLDPDVAVGRTNVQCGSPQIES